MFLDDVFIIWGIIGIPFALIILLTSIVVLIYMIYLIILTIKYRAKYGLKDLQNLFLEETTSVPNYEPAIMAYLVNYQKIGRREICSTLFDLIGRGVIKITLKEGFANDDNGKYILKLNEEYKGDFTSYESKLLKYLFDDNKSIKSEALSKRLYKKNLNQTFYIEFLRLIQEDSKQKDFFDIKTGKRKVRVYKFIDKIVTIIAAISSGLVALVGEIDEVDSEGIALSFIIFSLITAAIMWSMKFLISFLFNLTCFYNEFSENGNEDYKKWMGFKKFLKTYSQIPNHPLMGIMVWERYYAYAIGLKCSKKFYKQMKQMKIVDNSIDIALFETFNDIIDCIGTSAKRIKKISLDNYGGSHVDY